MKFQQQEQTKTFSIYQTSIFSVFFASFDWLLELFFNFFFKIGTNEQHTATNFVNCFIIRPVSCDYHSLTQLHTTKYITKPLCIVLGLTELTLIQSAPKLYITRLAAGFPDEVCSNVTRNRSDNKTVNKICCCVLLTNTYFYFF